MNRRKVLITAPRAAPVAARYCAELGIAGFDVVTHFPDERLTEAELLPIVTSIDGIVCGDDRISSRVMDAAPRLRVIAKWGTGIDSIDVAAATDRGIVVCNSPGSFNDPVADTVLAYILLFARGLNEMAEDMRAGHWRRLSLLSLSECTLGIVGLGQIGSAVARRAAAFGMRTLAATIQDAPDDAPSTPGLRIVQLESLLAESDFVTLHADLREGNRHLIGRERLALMKQSAVLINTARGSLIDEHALISALENRLLAGAALDVFEYEPLPPDSPLRRLPNVHLAPHNANACMAAAERVHANCIRQVLDVLGTAEQR